MKNLIEQANEDDFCLMNFNNILCDKYIIKAKVEYLIVILQDDNNTLYIRVTIEEYNVDDDGMIILTFKKADGELVVIKDNHIKRNRQWFIIDLTSIEPLDDTNLLL